MTVFSVMVKGQKSRFLPSGFLYTEIIIAKPKVNIHGRIQSLFYLRSSFFVLICFLGQATHFCSSSSLPRFDYQHHDRIACWKIARIFDRVCSSPRLPHVFNICTEVYSHSDPATEIGKFRISERPGTSACFRAKERLMRVSFGKKTNKHEEIAAGLPESEENLKGLRLWWAPN